MGIQGIQHGNVDSPRAWILPHRQRTESLAQTIRKGSHEIGLGPDDFEGGQIGTPELTLDELEKLGAIGGECGRKIRASRYRERQQSLDLDGRNPATEQEFRELGRHLPSVAPSTPELEDDLGLTHEAELVSGRALDVGGVFLDAPDFGAQSFDLA
jgi:hypothetical protein